MSGMEQRAEPIGKGSFILMIGGARRKRGCAPAKLACPMKWSIACLWSAKDTLGI